MINSPSKYRDLLLSIVTPVYFEEECISEFIKRTTCELEKIQVKYEIVFIDDGSTDQTINLIKKFATDNQNIKLIEFSYNHGKEAALTAGITFARGDYVILMDPDLQDPPDEIVNFLDKILEGYDLVFGVRREKSDTFLNKLFSYIFWLTLDKLTNLKLPRPLAVMRIFNRRFAEEFLKYRETNRFIEGLFMKVGMNWTSIPVSQHERFAGISKFDFHRKMRLALRAIFDFSEIPLKLATRFGALLIALSLLSGFGLIIAKVFLIDFQLGWPSIVVTLLFGFGSQIFFLGLIGKYIGNIYLETKQRPLFSIRKTTNI